MSIVIGFDDSPYGRDALALGLLTMGTREEPGAVVTVFPEDDRGLVVSAHDSEWVQQEQEVAQGKLQKARAFVGERSNVHYESVGPASVATSLHRYADRHAADLLVVGSSAGGRTGRLGFGNTVERLMYGAPCPVTVAPPGYHKRPAERIDVIAVAYDGTSEAGHALHLAVGMAEFSKAALRLVAVVSGRDESEMSARLKDVAESVSSHLSVTTEVITDSDVVDTLADLPDRHPELLVCGSRGYGPARQVLLGSVSRRVLRRAAYPVVVMPRGADSELSTASL